ncbi:MAG TPA: glycosyltransferase family 87 protein [Candidatus Binataceae bacterium]|nr:glycosyltransferase family 87 protein [Candidatus Binataceae bacterium]
MKPPAGTLRQITVSRTYWLAAAAVLLIVAATTTVTRIQHFSSRYITFDFNHYYAWAAEYAAGEPLWLEVPASGYVRPGVVRTPFCNYTPFFVESTAWLARFGPQTAHTIWEWLQVACVVLAILMLARSCAPPLELAATLAAIALALSAQSFRLLLFLGQCSPLLLVALAGFWLAARRGRPAAGGLCLAVATLLKLYPGILGGYLLIRRRWRQLGWTAGFALLGIVATGPTNWLEFFRFSPVIANLVLENFRREFPLRYGAHLLEFTYLASAWLTHQEWPPLWARASLSIALGAAMAAILLRATLHSRDSNAGREGLVFGLWVAAGLIFSPLSGAHEFPLLDPAYLFAILLAYRAVIEGAQRRGMLAAGIVLLAICLAPELIHQVPAIWPASLVPMMVLTGGMLLLEARPSVSPPAGLG